MEKQHEHYMKVAIDQAVLADAADEVPVGAILVDDRGQVIAKAHNRTLSQCDPSAHAEINVLRAAGQVLNNYRLLCTTLYATIEPCPMCMGAIVHARVATVVFGVSDPKWGAAGSLYNFGEDPRLNHQVQLISGVCEDRCRSLIQEFFRRKRKAGQRIP